MTRSATALSRDFNDNSHGDLSFIEDGHKAVFMALTSGEPNFCLTSIYVNGRPGVAIVHVGIDERSKRFLMTPCFVSVVPGLRLRTVEGEELGMNE